MAGSPMKAWSRLRWLGGRLPSGLVAGGFVAVLVAACWGLSYGLGGAGNAPPLWFLLPIMVAGARFGLVGALLVAGASGILAGPLLPDSVARHLAQQESDWMVRWVFFFAVACVMAGVRGRLRRETRGLEAARWQAEQMADQLATDVATRESLEGELRLAERRFRSLVEGLPLVTYIDSLTETAANLYSSPQIEAMFGYTPQEWGADPGLFPKILHPDDSDRVLALVAHCNETGEAFRSEYRIRAKDGRYVWVQDESVIVYAEDGAPLYAQGYFMDISDRKRAEEELHRLAFHDPLTGLPNRWLFEQQLEWWLSHADRSGATVGVLFVDLDDFKLVNDSFGHTIGDELLRQVADRLKSVVRSSDLVSRQGGDEFLILITSDAPTRTADAKSHATRIAGNVRRALERPFRLAGRDVYARASIGISLFPIDASDAVTLLKHADAAMYASKTSGRDRYRFYAQDGHDALAELSMAARLRSALENQEFVLHYEPIVALGSQQLIGAEALIRWRSPDGRLLLPAEFLPLAERVGLLPDISKWVLTAGCHQARQWQAQNVELYVSANLPTDLWNHTTMRHLVTLLDTLDLAPNRLMIELTESTAGVDLPTDHDDLQGELQRRGVRLAIDDFGTGYSAISRLTQMLVTTIKIDRSFMNGVPNHPEPTNLLRAIIQLAQNLGLNPIAEGVETLSQQRFLLDHGCTTGQGFLFSPALPAHELEAHYHTQRPKAA